MAVHNPSLIEGANHLPDSPRIAIITAEFNETITHGLLEKTKETIFAHRPEAIVDEFFVPGAMELPGMTSLILEKSYYNCFVLLGCVIKGDTPHFDYVCDAVTQGYTKLSVEYNIPIIFGVLTVDTLEQAQARVTDSYGVYTLNYLAQWMYADNISDQKATELEDSIAEAMQDFDLSDLLPDE